MKTMNFKDKLRNKMDSYLHLTYQITKSFPKEEIYGIVSQLRRASLSIILNYIEGYARRKIAVQFNFLEISYGSLIESNLLFFSKRESWVNEKDYDRGIKLADETGAMLWTEIINLEKNVKR